MLNDALKYIKKGLAIVPLVPGQKFPPRIKDYYDNPIDTEEKAQRHWLNHPRDGIGIILGEKYGIMGVDIDVNHGATPEMLKDLCPRTVTVKTMNGFHPYLMWKPGLKTGPLVPVGEGKAWNQGPATLYTGGRYFVAPGTIISRVQQEDGTWKEVTPFEYTFYGDAGGDLSFDDMELAEPPAKWFNGQISTTTKGTQPDGKYGKNARHSMFVRTATAMRKRGCSEEHIYAELLKRNGHDCDPPKPDAIAIPELKALAAWAVAKVQVSPYAIPDEESGDYLVPVGFRDDIFYYTSSRNKQIVPIAAGSHSPLKLMSLMPQEYWKKQCPKTKTTTTKNEDGTTSTVTEVVGVNWQKVASELMESCLDMGYFDEKSIRGSGCWQENGKLIIHTGESLVVDGQEAPINHAGSRYIYPLSASYLYPELAPLTVEECKKLVAACAAPTWEDPSSSIFLCGAMALLRVSGALNWRPHLWLTGSKGTGKSTLIERVVGVVAGSHGLKIVGNSTEAGIRQTLAGSSRPVVFDESETEDPRSDARIKQVVHFFRQSSTESDAMVVKGTPDGSALHFKASSMGILGSIRVNLTEEADLSRFTVLELNKHDASKKYEFLKALDPITPEYADRLFKRMVLCYGDLMQSIQVFEDAVSELGDRRIGQQLGTLLAGYWHCVSDKAVTKVEAVELVSSVFKIGGITVLDSSQRDEHECLNHVLCAHIQCLDSRKTIVSILELAKEVRSENEYLVQHGLDCDGHYLYLQSRNPELGKIYNSTRWAGKWANTLRRLPGAVGSVQRKFSGRNIMCVKVPLSVIFEPKSTSPVDQI